MNTENLCCPGCGEPWAMGMEECPSCFRPVVITTFNSVHSMSSQDASRYAKNYRKSLKNNGDQPEIQSAVAMCYLKLGLYEKAVEAFEAAIEDDFENAETYFYAAVSLLAGKKAFLAQRATIDKVEEYIKAAIMVEPRGIFYYFWAYIKYDFFERKYLNTSPYYQECLDKAHLTGLSQTDTQILFDALQQKNPFA